MYNAKSLKAEEFISDQEIKETLAYADANKDNISLIDEIIEKAKKRRIDFTKGEKVVEYLNTWDWIEEENQPTRLPNRGKMWILYHKFDLNGK